MLQHDVESMNFPLQNESIICNGFIQTQDNKLERMFVEDLAALERLTDETILEEIKNRYKAGETYSFIGDILLSMNPNKELPPTYDRKVMEEAFMESSFLKNSQNFYLDSQSIYVQIPI